MQDAPKAVWSIPYVSVAYFPSLKHNFIAYRSSKVSDCIFEIHRLWQSGFSRVYSNCCCCCSFETEILKIGQSSHKMYSHNILKFQKSTTILNACRKKCGNLSYAPHIYDSVTYCILPFSLYSLSHKVWTPSPYTHCIHPLSESFTFKKRRFLDSAWPPLILIALQWPIANTFSKTESANKVLSSVSYCKL